MSDWINYLGLASKAGCIATGEDNIINKVRNHDVFLVVVATDASSNSKKKYSDKCTFYRIKCIEHGTIDEISNAIGKNNRVAVGICDKGFANGLLAKITK